MVQRTRRGEAERPRLNRGFGEGGHGCNVFVRRVFSIGAAFAHDIDPQGGMRHLRTKIDVKCARLQAGEIIGKALPIPGQAFGQNREGNVFNPLHQPYQTVVILRSNRREADAAIAHNGGRHAMIGRGRQRIAPGDLAIIMCVNIDKARRHQFAFGIDFLSAGARYGSDG